MSVFPNSSKTVVQNNFLMVKLSFLDYSPILFWPFFALDYINQVLSEEENMDPKSNREEWDSPITFTAKSSRKLNFDWGLTKLKINCFWVGFDFNIFVLP